MLSLIASNQLRKAIETFALGGKIRKKASGSHQTLLVGARCTP